MDGTFVSEPIFVHLHIHTEFSLSDGILYIPTLMAKAAEFKMPALALTDLNNLYAAVKFYQEAMQAGIKPIIGANISVNGTVPDQPSTKLTLLCQNNLGYKNLTKILSKSYIEGQSSGLPLVESAWLKEYGQGLIALSGGLEGDIGQAIVAKDLPTAKKHLQTWLALFPNRFYIEISRVGKREERDYISQVLQLAEKFQVPVVATNDVRFLERDDFEAHEARVCIQQGVTLADPQRKRTYTDQQYFRSQQEMQKLFSDIPQALANTLQIAKRCNVSFDLGKPLLPHFAVPKNYSTESYLAEMATQGLKQRLQTLQQKTPDKTIATDQYEARLQRELDVINKMGFAGYFLIVADFTKWAKENGIPVGPGRGSGPGSLVAYALNITDLDPIALELLFERFLNPERVSMPDFDIDFCMEGRDRVIEYVMHRHGHESVAQIITYGTMAAKAVVRDVGRVLALGYGFVDKIAKLIPFEIGMTLEKALTQEPQLKERYNQEEEVKTLIDLGLKLEGITRNVGKHAGGIVIAPGNLTDFVPLYCEPMEAATPVTQFDKDDVEAVGLVKFDFLGLKTLTIIDRALKIVNKQMAEKKEAAIDISLIPLDDPASFKLLKACKSTAVFQLESHGMRDLIKRLQPDCFEDLTALVALFRPGPLQSGMVEDFINRKHGRAKVSYPHADLEPILRPTYGVIVYQEQVMQIAQVLAGYTLGAADILRRAMGKKKPEEMAKQREIFCKGATARGVNADLANQIFDLMEKFAGYGFNKSHSASYALIAYQTAWLKTHFPAAFMAAVLSSEMDRTEKIIILLEECKALKLEVTPPDINKSHYFFNVIDDTHLMYGLGAIKGVGEAAIENIIAVRDQSGPFTDLFDFCERIDLRKANRRVLEALIKSGCFDKLGHDRAQLFASLDNALQQADQTSKNALYGQVDLLGMHETKKTRHFVDAAPWPDDKRLQGEKETLGFYLSGHPLNRYSQELASITTCKIKDLHPTQHSSAKVAGIIINLRTRMTKRGDKIAIFSLDDSTTQIEVVCFSECYNKFRHLLNEDHIIMVDGDVSIDDFNNSARITGREIYTLDEARQKHAKSLTIHINSKSQFNPNHIRYVLTKHLGGTCPVYIHYTEQNIKAHIRLGSKWQVKPSENLLESIQNELAAATVEFVYE